MFKHEKQLFHPVAIEKPNPKYAVLLQEQLGGANGELKAAMQYMSQSFRIKDAEIKDLFLDILDGIDITNRTNTQEIEEKFIATVACKAAVKANMKLDEREIRGLLDQLMLLENPFTCPHGRPTAIRISKYEIEKKFNRR